MRTEVPPGRGRAASVLDRVRPAGDGTGRADDLGRRRHGWSGRDNRVGRIVSVMILLVGGGIIAGVVLNQDEPAPFASDDFNRSSLSTQGWTTVDPLGDGSVGLEGTWTADAWLRMSLPAGRAHDPWESGDAVRVLHATRDVDFSVDVAFESVPDLGQAQGLLVEQGDGERLVFGLTKDGDRLHARAVSTSDGRSATKLDEPIPDGSAIVLRVTRSGDEWTMSTSSRPDPTAQSDTLTDEAAGDDAQRAPDAEADPPAGQAGADAAWTRIGSFARSLRVTRSGPFVGNTGEPAPGYTTLVDYVVDTDDPLPSEDTYSPVKVNQLVTDVEGEGIVQRSPDRAGFPTGRPVTLTAEAAKGWAFAGWSGDLQGVSNPTTVVMDEKRSITASFVRDTSPPAVSDVRVSTYSDTAIIRWTTDEPSTSTVAAGAGTDYELGTFGTQYATRDHAVTLHDLQPGTTYHYSLRPEDKSGLAADTPDATFATPATSGPAIDLWQDVDRVVGHNGQPQSWVNIGGHANDPQGVRSMSFSVNGGAARPLTVGTDMRRLQAVGDFNAEVPYADLRLGRNEVTVTATDDSGDRSSVTVNIQREQVVPPLPFRTDWAAAARIGDQAQVVDGKWGLDGETVHILEMGYDRIVTVGDVSWRDYEVTVPVTVHGIGPGAGAENSGPALVGMGLHWQGHTVLNGEQPARHWYPTGALVWYRWYGDTPKFELRGNDDQPIVRDGHMQLDFDQTYVFKARAETVPEGVRYSFKAWPQGQSEPANWHLTVTEDAGPETGSIALIAHHTDTQFGDVVVDPLPQQG